MFVVDLVCGELNPNVTIPTSKFISTTPESNLIEKYNYHMMNFKKWTWS